MEMKIVSKFVEYVKSMADKKDKTPKEWLETCASNAQYCTLASHNAKLSYPEAKVALNLPKSTKKKNGYIYTTNIDYDVDVVASAGYLATSTLLTMKLEDERIVYDHVCSDSVSLIEDLKSLDVDFSEFKKKILKTKNISEPKASDIRIRQVYFPVADGEYHLLSVLPASSLVYALKKRIAEKNQRFFETRDKESKLYGQKSRQIKDLTEIRYGGSHTENISLMNSLTKVTYLLSSLPPSLDPNRIKRPHKNFFTDCIYYKYYEQNMRYFHRILQDKRNNLDIRQRRDECLLNICDHILGEGYRLSAVPEGWSELSGCQISEYQKIWLDEKNRARRKEEEWLGPVSTDFARWFIFAYEKVLGKEHIMLSTDEMHFIADTFYRVLEKERRFA